MHAIRGKPPKKRRLGADAAEDKELQVERERVEMTLAWFSSVFSARKASKGYEICLGTRVAQLAPVSVSYFRMLAL
jgi:hypothetical protein